MHHPSNWGAEVFAGIDGSDLFLKGKVFGKPLKYDQLLPIILEDMIVRGAPPSLSAPKSLVTMWTSRDRGNEGQTKLLNYLEQRLGYEVRGRHPSEAFIVDPSTAALSSSPQMSATLLRFDADIAFSMGRVAETHHIIVVSSSYALAEPMVRCAGLSGRPVTLAFFGHLLDPRWNRRVRNESENLRFVDLDDHVERLFGFRSPAEVTGKDNKLY